VNRDIPELPRKDEAVRDGIAEEDNKIPLWFNVGFYGMIVLGIIYICIYTLGDWSQAGQYEAEVAVATEKAAAVQASLPTTNPYKGDAEAIAEGGQLWATTCAVCHKPDGSGLVGPSLIDPYWKYGSDDASRYETVANGRPAGMPPWAAQLGSDKIWKILAYTETLPRSDEPGVGSPDYVPPGG
jgi:cytochrome c oxidase cbb3-type subunit 3